jgi:hypothetical protein
MLKIKIVENFGDNVCYLNNIFFYFQKKMKIKTSYIKRKIQK